MSIEGIFLAPQASMPMKFLQEGTLVAGRGLQGDRYSNFTGTYSHLRLSKQNPGQREPGRQLTLLSADSVEAALKKCGLPEPSSLGDIRRNIVLREISADELLNAVGHEIMLGNECRVLVHRHCVPCMYNERKNGIPGIMEAIWNESGVSCQVLVGGKIKVGDKVEILAQTHEIDDGNQPPGYYIPPSKRTTEMVIKAMNTMREEKKKLLEIDPGGVKRVEASYQTVGLTFWPKDEK